MPGAKAKFITEDIDKIHELQEEVSKWHTKLSGVHVGSDWEEFLMHITGLGHLEIMKLGSLSTYDSKSQKAKFEKAVVALNGSLVSLHSSQQSKILMKDKLEDQQAGVKAYAKAAYNAVKTFKTTWKVKDFPAGVNEKYKRAKTMGGA